MRTRLAGSLILLCGVAAMLPIARAMAATPATMVVEGAKQGTFKGDTVRMGSASGGGEIQLLSVVRGGGGSADAMTGMAAGRRAPATVTVTKVYGPSSAELEQALATNETLREVVIVFEAGKSATGMAAQKTKTAQKLVLTNATITQIVQNRNVQTITLQYQSIQVTTAGGSTTATDDWETP